MPVLFQISWTNTYLNEHKKSEKVIFSDFLFELFYYLNEGRLENTESCNRIDSCEKGRLLYVAVQSNVYI